MSLERIQGSVEQNWLLLRPEDLKKCFTDVLVTMILPLLPDLTVLTTKSLRVKFLFFATVIQSHVYIIDSSTSEALKGDPVRTQFNNLKNTSLKVLSKNKAVITYFEHIILKRASLMTSASVSPCARTRL